MTKTYEVTAELVSKSALGHNVSRYTIEAKNSAEAIKSARRMMKNDGHTRQDGAVEYSAKIAEAAGSSDSAWQWQEW